MYSFHQRDYLFLYVSAYHAKYVIDEKDAHEKENIITPNTMMALVAISYSMSYASIVAFTTSQLKPYWDNGELQKKYPKRKTHSEIMKKELRNLEKRLKHFAISEVNLEYAQQTQPCGMIYLRSSKGTGTLSYTLSLSRRR